MMAIKAEIKIYDKGGPEVRMDGSPKRVIKRFIKLMAEMDAQTEEWDNNFTKELKQWIKELP